MAKGVADRKCVCARPADAARRLVLCQDVPRWPVRGKDVRDPRVRNRRFKGQKFRGQVHHVAAERIEKQRLRRPDKNGAGNDIDLDSATPSAARLSCSVVRYWSYIVDPADPKACPRKRPDGRLRAWTRDSR